MKLKLEVKIEANGKLCGDGSGWIKTCPHMFVAAHFCDPDYQVCDIYKKKLKWKKGQPKWLLLRCQECLNAEIKEEKEDRWGRLK